YPTRVTKAIFGKNGITHLTYNPNGLFLSVFETKVKEAENNKEQLTMTDDEFQALCAEIRAIIDRGVACHGEGNCIRCGNPAPILCYLCDACVRHEKRS